MRTGVKVPAPKVGLTKVRKIAKSSRQVDWRETRVAFARPVEQKKQRTFVAQMGKYSEVVQQLIGAAYARVALPSADQGLADNSPIFALADGAKGLKEALEAGFPNLQFILDRPHLKEHLYEGVEAMELPEKLKHPIVDAIVSLINRGKVQKIIKKFQNYQGTGGKEIETLANYLIRFRSLCSL